MKKTIFAGLLCCLFGFGAAFGAEPPTRLVSYTPDYVADESPEGAAVGGTIYDAVDWKRLKELDGEPELLVFTAKEPGVCSACDRARPIWEPLQDRFPITPIYCSLSTRPKIRGDVIALNYDVEAFPTFVLVIRNDDGTADEVDRWRGAGTFFDPLEKRIKRAFADAGFAPRIEREGVKPPKRKPRPIPGLNPPKPREDPKPRPKIEPPGKRPGRPRVSFEVDFSAYDLKEE